MRRSVEEGPDATAAQTFSARISEPAVVLVESRDVFEVGRAVNTDDPV